MNPFHGRTRAVACVQLREKAVDLLRPAPLRVARRHRVVHPLAGQGVNLGFGDAHSLADVLRRAPDAGDRLLLRRFERARAENILAIRWITDGLFRLFAADHAAVSRIRNSGLNLTDSIPVIKTLLVRRAIGVGEGLRQKER